MRETLYQWIGHLVCYYLLYVIVMNLVSKKEYQRYLKSFMGMVLVLLIVTPLLALFQGEYRLQDFLRTEEMRAAWEEVRHYSAGCEERQDQYLLYACKEEMGRQIRALFGAEALTITELEIDLKQGKEIMVKEIRIRAEKADTAGIRVGEVQVGGDDEKDPRVAALKKKLADVYQIEQAHIYISIG